MAVLKHRGPWHAEEDAMLMKYIKAHGISESWRILPVKAGLLRSGKSCRLRWMNYLRPDIKRGCVSLEEEDLIIRLHKLLGNRWSLIAGRLPGRTDNEIKNYWKSHLKKKVDLSAQIQKPSGATDRITPSAASALKSSPTFSNQLEDSTTTVSHNHATSGFTEKRQLKKRQRFKTTANAPVEDNQMIQQQLAIQDSSNLQSQTVSSRDRQSTSSLCMNSCKPATIAFTSQYMASSTSCAETSISTTMDHQNSSGSRLLERSLSAVTPFSADHEPLSDADSIQNLSKNSINSYSSESSVSRSENPLCETANSSSWRWFLRHLQHADDEYPAGDDQGFKQSTQASSEMIVSEKVPADSGVPTLTMDDAGCQKLPYEDDLLINRTETEPWLSLEEDFDVFKLINTDDLLDCLR